MAAKNTNTPQNNTYTQKGNTKHKIQQKYKINRKITIPVKYRDNKTWNYNFVRMAQISAEPVFMNSCVS
jgi:hypothetical protein